MASISATSDTPTAQASERSRIAAASTARRCGESALLSRQPRDRPGRVEDHRGCDDRPRERATPGLVDARDPADHRRCVRLPAARPRSRPRQAYRCRPTAQRRSPRTALRGVGGSRCRRRDSARPARCWSASRRPGETPAPTKRPASTLGSPTRAPQLARHDPRGETRDAVVDHVRAPRERGFERRRSDATMPTSAALSASPACPYSSVSQAVESQPVPHLVEVLARRPRHQRHEESGVGPPSRISAAARSTVSACISISDRREPGSSANTGVAWPIRSRSRTSRRDEAVAASAASDGPRR